MMGDSELKELAEDITANGLIIPLVYIGDVLVDGRNRLRACEIAGVQPTRQQLPADYSEAQILDYVVSANIHRRHLSPSQKAMLATALEQLYAAAAALNVGGRPRKGEEKPVANLRQVSEREQKSVERAAKAVGVSGRSVSTAKALKRDAPDLAAKVAAGEMTLNAAHKEWKQRQTANKPRREDAVVSDELIDNIVADIDAGKPHSRKDIADRYGISESTARDPIKTAEGIIKGRNETIDWDSIPGSKQEALERAKRSIRKELEREYAAKLAEAVKEERAQYVESLAQRKAKLDEDFQQMQALASAEYEKYRRINAIQKAKGGIITKAQYLTVIACLHPDNSASPEKRAEAFRIFNDDRVKLLLVKEDSQ